MPKAAPKRKAANGYKLAEPLPLGEVLQDMSKKEWKLGPSIGQGGFGEIYSAREVTDKSTKYPFVIKIEPHSNGPLFVEMHFYMRNAKQEDVQDFKKKMGLKTFGMPVYLGSGSHEYKGEKYRFVVMEKFGKDLWKTFLENNRVFPTTTVFKIALQMLDVLEYIHSKGYVHADLKGANILMGLNKDTLNKQMYLVDFGLATKCNEAPEFKPNPKKAHDGTIEYLSRDAHQGVQTRRGDLEILAYNIIQWLGCSLPWENKLKDPNTVHKLKQESMSNIANFMKVCFTKKAPPGPLVEFLNYLSTLKHNTKPDYKKIRKIFLKGLDLNDSLGQPIKFSDKMLPKKTPTKQKSTPTSTPRKKSAKRASSVESSEEEKENSDEDETTSDGEDSIEESTISRQTKKKISSKRKSDTPMSTPQRKSARRAVSLESSEDEKEHADEDSISDSEESAEEIIIPRSRQKKLVSSGKNQNEKKKPTAASASKETKGDELEGYTDAMREVIQRKLEKEKSKGGKKRQEKAAVNDMNGYTDSMKEIARKKRGRPTKIEK